MGLLDIMVHTEASHVTSLSNGGHLHDRLYNGHYAGPNGQLKFKLRKVSIVREFPPGCEPSSTPFILPLKQEEIRLESCQNGDKADDSQENQLVLSSEADFKVSTDAESKSCDDVIDTDLVEVSGEAVYAAPLSICFPDDEANKNVNSQSIDSSKAVKRKPPEIKVSVMRDFPAHTGKQFSEKSRDESTSVRSNDKQMRESIRDDVLDSRRSINNRSHLNTVRDVVVYGDQSVDESKEDTETDGFKEGNVAASNRIGVAKKKKAKKLSTKIRERGEGSNRRSSSDMQLIVWDRENPSSHEMQQAWELDVIPPPSHPSGGDGMRNKVKETLRLFHTVCRKLLQEVEAKTGEAKIGKQRVDFQASKILKDKGKFVNTGKQIIGTVPGVEVGDEFQYRMELNMIGLHKPSQGGIDYVKEGGEIYATSIVASGGYKDELDNSDVLIYTGQGGNVVNGGGKDPEDQKLERGNLALANSKQRRNPVRVIRGNSKGSDSRGYVYDGLYIVEELWQETGSHGKMVFKFRLERLPGQPELSWKVLKKSKKAKFREGLCKLDISEGKEKSPICAVNDVDDEQPPPFIYTVSMIYPDWCRPIPPKGCDCTTRCSESRKCSCVGKNYGGIPYNHDGAIVEAKPLVYECGPLCKCPPSCYNRVTQHGIRFELEIFKTETRGWGVRSLNSIPSGSFICEYAGELLEDKEAERRTGNDEYLFDIGNNYDSVGMMAGGVETETETVDWSGGFTIDAAKYGNIGRFVNHSCSPNLYAQNVLYDHEDTRIPHVMFFAMDNIPPLQELTYHYNYTIDQVRDSNGDIKRKDCFCGSSDCQGRLY